MTPAVEISDVAGLEGSVGEQIRGGAELARRNIPHRVVEGDDIVDFRDKFRRADNAPRLELNALAILQRDHAGDRAI